MRIRFVTAGGARWGLGHVMRTAVLAHEARQRGHAVSVALRGDEGVAGLLEREVPGLPIVPWADAADAVGDAEGVILDAPEPIAAELAAAHARRARTLVVDRTDHLDDATATVLPVLHGPPLNHPRLFQGARYLVTAPVVRAAAGAPYPGDRRIALVTFGGADPTGLTPRVVRVLLAAIKSAPSSPAPEVHVVLGPAFAEAAALGERLAAQGGRVHRNLSRRELVALMAQASFALTGFGTTVYDLALLGTPSLYWTHRAQDVPAARRLEGLGLGGFAGNGPSFVAWGSRAVMRRTVLNATWRARASAAGRALVGAGDGAAQVLGLVEQSARVAGAHP